jgi:hypothetical protein
MKSTLVDWMGKGVVALACAFGAWLQTEYGVPLWLSILDAVLLCLVLWLVLWLVQRRKDGITEAEKFLLGAMLKQNSAMVVNVFQKPQFIAAGQTEFYGEGEGAVGFAPVAAKYEAACEQLHRRGLLRQNEHGLSYLSESGGSLALKLAKGYHQRPKDIKAS